MSASTFRVVSPVRGLWRSARVRQAVRAVDGVTGCRVAPGGGRLVVDGTAPEPAVAAALAAAGHRAELVPPVERTAAVCEAVGAGPGVSRRLVIGGGMAAVVGALAAAGVAPAAASPAAPGGPPGTGAPTPSSGPAPGTPLPGKVKWAHAVGDPRGSDVVSTFGRATEARYGAMFRELPAFAPPDQLLTDLAMSMTEDRGPMDDIVPDGNDNVDMPSGFVYLGQFIDHDMTRDGTPLGLQRVDPHGLTNFDSPQFDLASVYGAGPSANPELYDTDRRHLLLRPNALGVMDLPRDANNKALTGDPRNDENFIINQLQQAFIMLHNRFLDREAGGNFARAQQLARWHYQWVIVHDFLPHVVGQPLVDSMLRTVEGRVRANILFYRPGNPSKPMMPIEYSAGAYRWGHSGIRPEYEMHDTPGASPNPAVLPIFDTNPDPVTARDLRGSRPLYPEAMIDWNYFFEIPGVDAPDDRNFARKVDTHVARPLFQLPDSVVAHVQGAILALAERNLLRGKRLGLPSGQDVADLMRRRLPALPAPLTNAQLGLTDPAWAGRAPLWFYCLKEAELGGGRALGPVAGRIVAEVILGLLQLDQQSYWNAAVPFTPIGGPALRMGDLLKLAGAPIEIPVPEEADAPAFGAARGVVLPGP